MMTFARAVLGFVKSRWLISAIILVILFGGYWFFLRGSRTIYQFIPVTEGSITETVSVTGNTTPAKSVSLGFQNAGTIARVNDTLGDRVSAGAVIAELDTANLSAALEQARANLAVAEANLASLIAGTRPEQLAIDQDAVTQDKAALRNAIMSAYAASDGAVHTNADQLFTNPRTSEAALAFTVSGMTLAGTVVRERIALEPVLTAWGAQVYDPSFNTSDPAAAAARAVQNLSQISAFLNDAASILTKVQPTGSLTAATLSTYEASVATARTSVSAALTALTTAQTALVGAEGALALAQAGPTAENVAAQRAQVEQAQAGVANAVANLQAAEIVAPMSGVITQLDAKVGQLASPSTPLVSIIGSGGFEVDAGVSEIDVGKLAVGDAVSMTLDAFPNETFTGSVFYIAPAQTNTQGVITYLIKISFDTPDPRLKSGLTANVDIQTKHKDNVLILPQYAILQNDSGTFVETLIGKTATTSPVTLGIQDQKGNVEILSGVTLGEQVINIGLKAQ
ncbi:MAG TPA: efflux RND transporter periplasmic adaptor subunit [Candidatus Paceibacterota bacterium]|nr:efflux RND transporter periplasmic adaptor subunit [Candidatus Paceibacterota bacterium]